MHHAILFSSCAEEAQRGTGAHRIATILRENDWDVEVVDFAAHWPIDYLKELVRSRTTSSTVFFGFSVFFNYWNNTLNSLTSWMKKQYPTIKTVIGGQSVALTAATSIDYWVDSFGEVAILELVKAMIGNTNARIKFDAGCFGDKKLIKSISSYPAFPMKSYKTIMEKRDYLQPWEFVTTEFARGCKFSCDFCNFPVLGVKGDYSRSEEDFEYEMRYNFDNFGIDRYYVADETFNDSEEKIIKFANVAEKLSFRPFFSGFMRADLMIANRSTWDHLIRLNFGGHYYGIETFNHASAKLIKKGMHPDKLKQGLLEIKQVLSDQIFYRGTISLIYGLPHETRKTLSETENWIMTNWLDQSLITFPLDIDKITDKNNNSYTNISKMSIEKEKYGIREMKQNDIQLNLDYKYKWQWRTGNYNDTDLMWEHDTMNIFEARKYCFDFQNHYINKLPIDSWSLHAPSTNANEKLPLHKNSNVSKINGIISRDKFKNTFLSNYITKKLSQ